MQPESAGFFRTTILQMLHDLELNRNCGLAATGFHEVLRYSAQ